MRYVILRDDDTNALTPVECLERLYRPFLDRGLPVNLAVIPDVATNALTPDGLREGFLPAATAAREFSGLPLEGRGKQSVCVASEPDTTAPIVENQSLVNYLRQNSGYHVAQHGCHHDPFEFDRKSPEEIIARLEHGSRLLMEAGFPRPSAFVAPHDKLSRESYRQVAQRFPVISTGWFELRRLPASWWLQYLLKRTVGVPHWRVGKTALLSHPGCLLSAQRNYDSMPGEISRAINSRRFTVLVTHWWEYFRDGKANEPFIHALHQTADYLASRNDVRVISFDDVAHGGLRLN